LRRKIFKIILFPISLLLTIFVAISGFIVRKCAVLLNILSVILFLAALLGLLQYLAGWPFGGVKDSSALRSAVIAGVCAFLLSPVGLPKLTLWMIGKLDALNGSIKSI